MKQIYNSIKFNRKDAIWWGIAIGMLIGRRFTGSLGPEWYTYYKAVFKGFQNMQEVANPAYTAVLLYPLTLFPIELGSEIFTLINIFAVALACRLTLGNRWATLLSFPFGWLVWYGQIDGLIVLGVGLGYWAIQAKRPYWVGIACLLLGIKPQIGGILALYYLWHIRDVKALVFPLIVMTLSVILFGFWPINYLSDLVNSSTTSFFTEQVSNIGLFPWGLISWVVFLFGPHQLKQRILLILGASMLSSPYTAHYSTLSLIIFPLPWWLYVFYSSPFLLPTKLDAPIVSSGVVALIILPVIFHLKRKTWRQNEIPGKSS